MHLTLLVPRGILPAGNATNQNQDGVGALARNSQSVTEELEAVPRLALTEPHTDSTGHVGAAQRVLVIEPAASWPIPDLRELWRYRDLFVVMVWRDISANYRQSLLGYFWALFRAGFSLLVYTLVFGRIARFPSDGQPYALFCLAGLLPWMYFVGSLHSSVHCVVSNSALLTKVYFPRLILPLTSLAHNLLDIGIQSIFLLGLMLWYGVTPGWQSLFLPAFVLLCLLTAFAVGIWLTALNVKFRDVGQVVPYLTQMWMWLTPIVYPSSMVSEKYRFLLSLNPMTGPVEGFRWALLGTTPPDWGMLAVSTTVVGLLLIGGTFFFQRTQQSFTDYV